MARQDAGMQLRLPADVKAWVERTAARNRRSKNGEIVFRLEAAMAADGAKLPALAGSAPAAGHSLEG